MKTAKQLRRVRAQRNRPRRVLIVDDHRLMRDAMTKLIEASGLANCVGTASAKHALASVRKAEPDLVISDFQMPDMDGLELTRKLKAMCPGLLVLLVSAEDQEGISTASSHSPDAILSKDAGSRKFLQLVHSLLKRV